MSLVAKQLCLCTTKEYKLDYNISINAVLFLYMAIKYTKLNTTYHTETGDMILKLHIQ